MPDQDNGLSRRKLFDDLSGVSLGIAATALIAEPVKAAPPQKTHS